MGAGLRRPRRSSMMPGRMRTNSLKRKLAEGRRVCGVLVDVYERGFQGLIVGGTGLLAAAARDFLAGVGRGAR